MVYKLGDNQLEVGISKSDIVLLDTRVDCGPILLEFIDYSNGSPLNLSLFQTFYESEQSDEVYFRVT